MLIRENDRLPKFHSYEDLEDPDQAIALIRFICNKTKQIWYPTEFDGSDTFYGFISENKNIWIRSYEFDWAWGREGDWNFFSLNDLRSNSSVVRDWNFIPCTIATVIADSEIFRIDQEKTGAFSVSCYGYCISSNIPNIKLGINMVEALGALPKSRRKAPNFSYGDIRRVSKANN